MAYIDCVEVHNINKDEGKSYIKDLGEGKKAFMLKRFDELSGEEKDPYCHAEFTKAKLVAEEKRLQDQANVVSDFIDEHYPS